MSDSRRNALAGMTAPVLSATFAADANFEAVLAR
jgi:hypothetical protein